MGKYLKKVKKIVNDKKEKVYPICPLLSTGNRHRRCIHKECVAYKDYEDHGFCNALHARVGVIYI